jgi:hypothetical protein
MCVNFISLVSLSIKEGREKSNVVKSYKYSKYKIYYEDFSVDRVRVEQVSRKKVFSKN